MTYPRYVYKDMPLTGGEAREIYTRSITAAEERLSALRASVEDAQQELTEILKSPLPTTRRVQVTLLPDDAGYDEAPACLCTTEYQGDAAWMNARRGDEWPADMGAVIGSLRGYLKDTHTQSGHAIPNPDYKDAPL